MDIQTIAEKSRPIFEKNHVVHASVFGSYARGEQRPDSDVDFVVNLSAGSTLLTLSRVQRELSNALAIKVDVVTLRSIHPQLRSNIEQDLKTIYEKK